MLVLVGFRRLWLFSRTLIALSVLLVGVLLLTLSILLVLLLLTLVSVLLGGDRVGGEPVVVVGHRGARKAAQEQGARD